MVLASLSPGQYLGTDPCIHEFLTSTRANTRAFKRPAKTYALEVSTSGSAAFRNRSPAAATGAARFVRSHVLVGAAGKQAFRSGRVLTGLRTCAADPPRSGRLARPATAASSPAPLVWSTSGAGSAVLSCGLSWADARAEHRPAAASPAELQPASRAATVAVAPSASQPTRWAAY